MSATRLLGVLLPLSLAAAAPAVAPRPALETVPFPPTGTLEPAVASQVRGLEESLARLLADAATSDAALAAAYGTLGETFHAYELWDAASVCYRNASRLVPGDYRWHHLRAEADAKAGRLDDALRGHTAALDVRPGDLPSLVGRGEALLALNRLDDAERAFRDALRVAPSSPAAHAGLARVALNRRQFAAARDGFTAALELAPEATRLHYELAMAYRGLGDRAAAAEHFARAGTVGVRATDPLLDSVLDLRRGARTHIVRGRLAYVNGRMREAADEFEAAVTAEPRSVTALVGLGSAQAGLGLVDDALATFRRALAVDPRNAAAHFNLASLFAARKDWDRAIEHYRAVLEVQPGDREAAKALQTALERSGRGPDAPVR